LRAPHEANQFFVLVYVRIATAVHTRCMHMYFYDISSPSSKSKSEFKSRLVRAPKSAYFGCVAIFIHNIDQVRMGYVYIYICIYITMYIYIYVYMFHVNMFMLYIYIYICIYTYFYDISSLSCTSEYSPT